MSWCRSGDKVVRGGPRTRGQQRKAEGVYIRIMALLQQAEDTKDQEHELLTDADNLRVHVAIRSVADLLLDVYRPRSEVVDSHREAMAKVHSLEWPDWEEGDKQPHGA